MHFRKIVLLLAFLPAALFSSCRFGLFNKDYPTSSKIEVFIDNQKDEGSSQSAVFSFDIDDAKISTKHLVVNIKHYKNSTAVDVGGFYFKSQDVKINTQSDSGFSIELENINTLGAHTIECISNISEKFNKTFTLIPTSRIKDFDINYSAKNHSNTETINTSNFKSSELMLYSGSIYTFSISSSLALKIPELSLNADSKYAEIEKIDTSHFLLKIFQCPDHSTFTLSIKIKNSSIGVDIPIITKIDNDINIEEKISSNDDGMIYLDKSEGRKDYDINLMVRELDSDKISACLLMQDDSEDEHLSIKPELKVSKINQSNYYMDLYLDTDKKTMTIIPKSETVLRSESGSRNVYFYLYFFDRLGSYIKRFKICISPLCEKIELSQSRIDARAQKSGCIEASLLPGGKSDIIWYFSLSASCDSHPPIPMKIDEVKALLSTSNNRLESTSLEISGVDYSSDEYFFAISPAEDSTFYYSTSTQAASVYLIAKCKAQNTFAQIPFLISADTQIILKSKQTVCDTKVPSASYTSIEEFENSLEVVNLPDGQHYPDTALENKYGDMTRTFYLPHDRISQIEISLTPEDASINTSSTKSANDIFTASLDKVNDKGEYILEIEPHWQRMSRNSSLDENIPAPASRIQDGDDAYGKNFYQYLGVGVMYLNVNSSRMTLRIVIY